MVRLDQEWCHMAMIIMNVQIVRFFRKNQKSVLAVCVIRLKGTDRQIRRLCELLGLRSEPELLPYHSSLLIIYIKAAMLVFDL
jgi:hypothetical protein